MMNDSAVAWALMAIFIFAGIGFLLAKVDDQQVRKLQALNRFFPAVRLYQFRTVRYGVAAAFFIMAAVAYLGLRA